VWGRLGLQANAQRRQLVLMPRARQAVTRFPGHGYRVNGVPEARGFEYGEKPASIPGQSTDR